MLKLLEAKCLLLRALLEKKVEFISDDEVELIFLLSKDAEVQIILKNSKDVSR